MKTPAFWKRKNRVAYLLWPLSVIYEMVYLFKRASTKQIKLPVPVICIGNVLAGGAGKTPVALHIGKLLKEKGCNPWYVSRGYGGSAEGPVQVNPSKHKSSEVGDEPLLLAQVLPTVVGKDRIKAARYAIKKGAKMVILDDGFQNKKIFKNISYLVIDGTLGVGNGFLLPAGPMRERLDLALARTHSVVMINPMPGSIAIPETKPTLFARTKVSGLAEKLRGQRVVAFCGIAYPEKFRRTLSEIGASLISFTTFADHENYSYKKLMPLVEEASGNRAYLVTTSKDQVRLPDALKDKVVVVDIELVFANQEMLDVQIDFIAGLQ